jgi:hypothetical protein
MKNFRVVTAGIALATALMTGGTAMAGDRYFDRQDIRQDEAANSRLRADIERDRCRLNDDLRTGHRREADHDRADLARDQRALDLRLHDVRHDRNDLYRDNFRGR